MYNNTVVIMNIYTASDTNICILDFIGLISILLSQWMLN